MHCKLGFCMKCNTLQCNTLRESLSFSNVRKTRHKITLSFNMASRASQERFIYIQYRSYHHFDMFSTYWVWSTLYQCSISITLENVRKPFLMTFSGGAGMKHWAKMGKYEKKSHLKSKYLFKVNNKDIWRIDIIILLTLNSCLPTGRCSSSSEKIVIF